MKCMAIKIKSSPLRTTTDLVSRPAAVRPIHAVITATISGAIRSTKWSSSNHYTIAMSTRLAIAIAITSNESFHHLCQNLHSCSHLSNRTCQNRQDIVPINLQSRSRCILACSLRTKLALKLTAVGLPFPWTHVEYDMRKTVATIKVFIHMLSLSLRFWWFWY